MRASRWTIGTVAVLRLMAGAARGSVAVRPFAERPLKGCSKVAGIGQQAVNALFLYLNNCLYVRIYDYL